MTDDVARRRGFVAAALVGALAFAACLPSLAGEFVYDDVRFVLRNPNVQRPESWLRMLTDAGTADPSSPFGIVRPLRTMEFALDRTLFGPGPLAFHVHSMLWHATAAVLLFFLLRRLLGGVLPAFGGAAIWALHAAQVESVAWITSRGDVAMGACSFAAILFALRSKGFDRAFAVSMAAAALAMLYKETGFAILFVVLVLRGTKLSRVPVWPYIVLAAGYGVYRFLVVVQAAPDSPGLNVHFVLGGSRLGTIATMLRAFGWYVCESLVPSFSQDWYLSPSTSLADGAVLGWLLVHAALVASAVVAWRREPRWTLAVALFYLFLAPVSNVLFSVSIPTAERFLYVPLAGLALAVGLALLRAPRAAFVATMVAAAALGVTSAVRSTIWRDEPTLWKAVIADHESPRGRESLAEAIESDAIELRDKAAAMPPGAERDDAERRAHDLFEDALANAHKSIDDTYSFELVKRSNGIPAMRAEYNASNMCYELGRDLEALYHAEEALAMYEDVAGEPHFDRALPLLRLGFPVQAMNSMHRARELARNYGGDRPDPWVAGFFLRAAQDCERLGLHQAARSGFGWAAEAAGPGRVGDEARRMFDRALARPLTAEDAEHERVATAELDAKLAALPRSCPVRKDYSIPK